ncbi:CFI-box-CTERM domain-containing protein [Vitiosangium sp. GDMCC 1.1324]|uniref:CFI-box-CTERM domain-containing protein n=1 Tax=Vitiosangium sp. (strain GDMCC 1.1324) TaxID=2138576 RepID=UPI000D372667|nr:CFI-box-CTERM domain-containing protein [Vitiosangium sp. GDMCC 1.1324]PTL85926.1 hypothetical protein DAT35_04350 [Vitiosangium sp. GDMCC 1.1324]
MPIDFDSYKEWLFKQGEAFIHRTILTDRLTVGQAAIQFTRQKLRHGAGNITEQVKKSKKYSTLYTIQAYELGDELNKSITTSKSQTLNRLASQAIVARKLGAGNCDHFAAVSFFYLLEHASPSVGTVFRVSVTGHSVAVLADKQWTPTDTTRCKTAVVVDAWPTNPFCVAWNDWFYKDTSPKIIIGVNPLSDGVVRERILKDFRADAKKADELYEKLQSLKRESLRHHLRYYYDENYQEATPSGRYPDWTDAHPLRSDHPLVGKKCFITTACTAAAGLADTCDELVILRRFRDGYLSCVHPDGKALIAEYYRIAPALVDALYAHPEAPALLSELLRQVRYCVSLIVREDYLGAVTAYQEMVTSLKSRVLFELP